ncbi:hypothetical protein HZF05_02265 [Sphingomonas sp. CGMCC 1.13654]|uniref:Uncharacterized protein n=1 Tax=Sphingomonas chungangi TaxID=2683589 RepID=A0A838L313_9SPHN|nr:hypothetical protein [Sphingomonas chungangi]MBA2932912.1 hypothetical protein [Sphingomonas chungangi]MVW56532.1 hypothetical protein [Sphingomonas chungangi]
MGPSGHILVLVSIIIGMAITDLLSSFHRLMIAGPRVRWFWPVPVLAVLQLLNLIEIWWNAYSLYTQATEVSIGAFLPDVALLTLQFLMAAAVFPDEVPEGGIDLRDYYWKVARYFWLLSSAIFITIFIFMAPRTTSPGATVTTFIEQWWGNMLPLAFDIVMIVSRREWLHKLLIMALMAIALWDYTAQAIG